MKGKVSAVCRGSERGKPKVDVLSGFFEKGLGFVGDAHSGTAKEVSLLLKENVDQLSRETGLAFPPGAFAENLLVKGLDQAQFVPGKNLKIGEAFLRIQEIGKEAGIRHTYHYQGFSLLPRFGIFAQVIESGIIKNGDEVELLIDSP